MAAAWTVSDYALYRVLTAYLRSLAPASWYVMDLYTNDYTPRPGDDTGDYVIPTGSQWPGYIGVQLPASGWTPVSVIADVAQTHQPDPAVFDFPLGVSSITLYGYLVTDGYGNLQWAERFATAIEAVYPGGVSIVASLNLGILPVEDEADPMVVAIRAHDSDDEYERE